VDLSAEQYCRDVERYLCRKNDGHLVRIVGPAFEQVCGWASRGIPYKVACRGIDRYFERYYARGPRRRPVRIEFCEADVLDVFDEWRRAVGAPIEASGDHNADADAGKSKRMSLPSHIERLVARLTTLRASGSGTPDDVLRDIVRELDAARTEVKSLRGDARERFLERLRAIDDHLVRAAREGLDGATLTGLVAEAESELAPFKLRMNADAYAQSRDACIDRLVRERAGLPTIAFE
jgi:hypothetical protein